MHITMGRDNIHWVFLHDDVMVKDTPEVAPHDDEQIWVDSRNEGSAEMFSKKYLEFEK